MIFCPNAGSQELLKIQKGGGPEVESTNTKPKLHEKTVSNEQAVTCSSNTIQKMFDNHRYFKAGQIANALCEWQNVTSGRTILQFVRGVKMEFCWGQRPQEDCVRPSNFVALSR